MCRFPVTRTEVHIHRLNSYLERQCPRLRDLARKTIELGKYIPVIASAKGSSGKEIRDYLRVGFEGHPSFEDRPGELDLDLLSLTMTKRSGYTREGLINGIEKALDGA